MTDRPTVLVTGGAGYIGSHACRALAAAGYQPVVYDNLSTGHRSFVAGALVTGDLLDGATLARAFAEHKIAAVMHFAAASLVGESMTDPQKYYINNVAGHAVAAAGDAQCGCHRIVFSSTGAVYGNARLQGAAGRLSLRADQPLRRVEMDDRAHARRLPRGLRLRRVLPALFQCQRRRSGRRHRRTARQRNTSHPARHDGAAGPCRLCRVRRRLRHARRHRDPRLHPRHRPRGGACRGVEAAGRRDMPAAASISAPAPAFRCGKS